MSQPPDDAPRPPPLPGGGVPADPAPPSFPSRPRRPGWESTEQEGPPVLYAQSPSEKVDPDDTPEDPEIADATGADQVADADSAAAADHAAAIDPAAIGHATVDPAAIDPAAIDHAAIDHAAIDHAAIDHAAIDADQADGPAAATVEPTGKTTNAPATAAPPSPSALAARMDALRSRIHLTTEAVYVRLRWHLRELVEDLRTRDRFFRWKAAIIAGWIALSFVSLGVARSGAPAAPAANRLQAYVVIRPTTMGWGLLVHNQSRKAWRAVEIRLDGYTYRVGSVAAGEQLILGPFQFERDGQILRSEHVPQSVEIAAEQGTMVLDLLEKIP